MSNTARSKMSRAWNDFLDKHPEMTCEGSDFNVLADAWTKHVAASPVLTRLTQEEKAECAVARLRDEIADLDKRAAERRTELAAAEKSLLDIQYNCGIREVSPDHQRSNSMSLPTINEILAKAWDEYLAAHPEMTRQDARRLAQGRIDRLTKQVSDLEASDLEDQLTDKRLSLGNAIASFNAI